MSIIKLTKIILTFFLISLMSACGGGSSDSSLGNGDIIADAGSNQTVARSDTVTLDGSKTTADSGIASYTWTQTKGPDVTGGSGSFTGINPGFTAPNAVDTIKFELKAKSNQGDEHSDSVYINVLESTENPYFVDADNGSDSNGDGSLSNPYASIGFALQNSTGSNADVYVKAKADNTAYDESSSTLQPADGVSLYGGYDVNWVRQVGSLKTKINGHYHAINFANVSNETWLSGFEISTIDSTDSVTIAQAISLDSGQSTLHIEDNIITAGNVGSGFSSNPASSYALRLTNANGISVKRNTLTSGQGGNGTNGYSPTRAQKGGDGANPTGINGAVGGVAGNPNGGTNRGGHGGEGGSSFGANGASGKNGYSITDATNASSGSGGAGGAGGNGSGSQKNGGHGSPGKGGKGGIGGDGATGVGTLVNGGYYKGNIGQTGIGGQSADGGGGGGGAEADLTSGGAGAGGGGGGRGGVGGRGGYGAGGSFGIIISSITSAVIENNIIVTKKGGDGGDGGIGGSGGFGGDGGTGRVGDSGNRGGDGGGGGRGGSGGHGGGGDGGPSIAILIDTGISPTISNNTLQSGTGGEGGSGSLGGYNGVSGSGKTGGTVADLNNRGASGSVSQGGYSYGIYDLDPNDGLVPVTNNNSITAGTAGTGGQAGDQNF